MAPVCILAGESEEPTPRHVSAKAYYALGIGTLVLFGLLGSWFWLMAPNMPWAVKFLVSLAISLFGFALPYWECRDSRSYETPDRLWQRLKSNACLGLILNIGLAAAYFLSL